MTKIIATIYTTLVAVSLSLGFLLGRARNGARLVNLSRSWTKPTAVVRPTLLQSRTPKRSNSETGNDVDGISSSLVVNDDSTSLRVNATDDCKMVGRNLCNETRYSSRTFYHITGICRSNRSGDDFWKDCSTVSISSYCSIYSMYQLSLDARKVPMPSFSLWF